jgi:hypothetical protein
MTNEIYIKLILAFHGYSVTSYKTSMTGTNDGQSENTRLYDIEAKHNTNGDVMTVYEPGFNNALHKIFSHIHSTELSVVSLDEEEFDAIAYPNFRKIKSNK